MDTQAAFDFYQSIAHRLPGPARFPTDTSTASNAPNLLAIASEFDAFVFDAFGVLNVGGSVIPGAVHCVAQLRAMGKKMCVLTNGASLALSAAGQKYQQFGFDFSPSEVVSSRYAAEQAIDTPGPLWSRNTLWGAITGGVSAASDLRVNAIELVGDQQDYDKVDAFLFLSAGQWSDDRQQCLSNSLEKNPRPVVVANPDVVAPLVSGFSLEPGYYAHLLLNRFEQAGVHLPVHFHGKPFPSVYGNVLERLAVDVPARRIAMLGDTLHTDVLGAKVQGWTSVLVSGHGLFRGHDVHPFIRTSGLTPDWIIPSI